MNKKKVLAIFYSQSGQLKTIIENYLLSFQSESIDLEMIEIKPESDFTFPWSSKSFFDAMPESVLETGCELSIPKFKHADYDLVIFGYQPWFLSPSIPATAILKDPRVLNIIKNKPVITIIGARNMWTTAQAKIKKRLYEAGAKLKGNIVLFDRNPNLISAITIQYWMFTGKKDKFLGIFPKPGVSAHDISKASDYGALTLNYFNENKLDELQNQLIKNKAVQVSPILMFIETRGFKIFEIWAKFIIRQKQRSIWLLVFKFYLIVALFFISPIVIFLFLIVIFPLTASSIAKQKHEHLSVLNTKNA